MDGEVMDGEVKGGRQRADGNVGLATVSDVSCKLNLSKKTRWSEA